MLKIKASVRPDKYGGRGLFADEFIPKGTVVWEESEKAPSANIEEYFQMPENQRREYERYAYPLCLLDVLPKKIELVLCTDDARYMNHDDDPNIGPIDEGQTDYALHDIAKDDEITCDYRVFDPLDLFHAAGIPTCKTFLLDKAKKEI